MLSALLLLPIFGAEIGADTRIELGVRVLGIQQLHIGAGCVIGTRSLVDARGEIVIADNASAAGFVLGADPARLTDVHLRDARMGMTRARGGDAPDAPASSVPSGRS